MARRYHEFRVGGVDVVAVAMSRPERLAVYLADRPLPFAVLADPDRRAYAAVGLERTTWGRMIRPGILWRFIKALLRGGRFRGVAKGEDPLQTGGDFLFGPDGRLAWWHTTPDPTGRPTLDRLLAAASALEWPTASGENRPAPATPPT